MAKEIKFYGKTEEELKNMDLKEFAKLVSSRRRRTLLRGLRPLHKRLMEKVALASKGKYLRSIKTPCRVAIVVPSMLGLTIQVHNGKTFSPIKIETEMLGSYLGELTMTRQKVSHSAPGIGATRSSSAEKK